MKSNFILFLFAISFLLSISLYAQNSVDDENASMPMESPKKEYNKKDKKILVEIDFLKNEIKKTEDQIKISQVELIEALREQNLNKSRMEMLAQTRNNAIERYLECTEYARQIEDYDRRRIFNAKQYYEIVEHDLPAYFPESNLLQKSLLEGWVLIFGSSPLKENGLFNSITIHTTQNNLTEKQAYAIILTPVEKYSGPMVSPFNDSDPEIINLNNILKYGGLTSYLYPQNGYRRTTNPTLSFLVKKVTAINVLSLKNKEIKEAQVMAYSCDGPLNCRHKGITNILFGKPLMGLKGDYVALLVPSDDYLAYLPIANTDALKGDFYCPISEKTVNQMIALSPQNINGTIISLPDINDNRNSQRYAAFTFYGEYMLPPQK